MIFLGLWRCFGIGKATLISSAFFAVQDRPNARSLLSGAAVLLDRGARARGVGGFLLGALRLQLVSWQGRDVGGLIDGLRTKPSFRDSCLAQTVKQAV